MLKKAAVLSVILATGLSAGLAQSLYFPSRYDYETSLTLGDGNFGVLGSRLASGDFNGDNFDDAVLTFEFGVQVNPTDGESVGVLLGRGNGLFSPGTFFNMPLNAFAGDVEVGDFNNDGDLDFVVAVEDTSGFFPMDPNAPVTGGVVLYVGDGMGGFTRQDPDLGGTAEASFTGLAVGRLNGDAFDDVALINSAAGTFSLFTGGAGGLSPLGSAVATCANPVAAALGQLNQTAGDDLVVVCDPPGAENPPGVVSEVRVLTNNGVGTLDEVTNQPTPTSLADPRAVVIVDLNKDTFRDVAIANSFLEDMDASGSVTLLKNDGLANLIEGFLSGVPVPVGDSPRSIDAADIDGDGDNDLLVANWNTDDLSILVATVSGSGSAAQPTFSETFFAAGIRVYDAVFADLDNELPPAGDLDILAANVNDLFGTLSSWVGGGNDLVLRAERFVPSAGQIDGPNAIAVADFNLDGYDDFAIANAFADTVSIFRSTAGDASPSAPFALLASLPFQAGDLPFDVLATDLDNDNDPDLVVVLSPDSPPSTPVNGSLVAVRNNGSGSFTALAKIPVGELPHTVVAARINGDLLPDLAVTNLGDDTVSVFLAGAGLIFTPATPATFATNVDPLCDVFNQDCLATGVAAGDLDGDNDTDLVVSAFGSILCGGSLRVFEGNGMGAFTAMGALFSPAPVNVCTDPDDMTKIQMVSHEVVGLIRPDGNAGTPLAVVGIGLTPDDLVSVFLDGAGFAFTPASGSPFFMPGLDIASPGAPRNTSFGDLNGDSIPDLAISGIASNNAGVLLGVGDGTFTSSRTRVDAFGAAKEANAVAAADIDGDGLNELLVPGIRLNDVAILRSGLGKRSDVNGNGRVDGFDLVELSRNFPMMSVSPATEHIDVNMDGKIDEIDFTVMAAVFGKSY